MALRFINSIDNMNASVASLAEHGWINVGTLPSVPTTLGRFGNQSLFMNFGTASQRRIRMPFVDWAGDTFIMGFAFLALGYASGASAPTQPLISIFRGTSGTSSQNYTATVMVGSFWYDYGTSTASIRDANNAVAWSAVVSSGFYHYIAFKIDQGTGQVTVYIDGVAQGTFAGDFVGTQAGQITSPLVSIVVACDNSSNCEYYLDDWYLADDQGTANNDIIPECRMVSLRPSSTIDAGAFTLAGAATVHDAVDDPFVNDGDTTHAQTELSDTFEVGLNDHNVTPTPIAARGVQALMTSRKVGTGVATHRPQIKSGASTKNGVATALSTSYETVRVIADLDPNGDIAWTPASINGASVVADIAVV